MVLNGSGVVISPDAGTDEIAEILNQLITNPKHVANMKQTAWDRRKEMSWDRAVSKIGRLICEDA
jgi:hypothetical protein